MQSVKKFKLPDMSKFASERKDISPYERFHLFFAKKLGGVPEGQLIDVGALGLLDSDFKTLEKLAYRWIRKFHYRYSAGLAKMALLMHNLEISPSTIDKETAKENKLIAGYVYLRRPMFQGGSQNG